MNKPILQVEHLTKMFTTKKFFRVKEQFTAVNDISFELKEGEILGMLGPNGAGKTTTIQMLLNLLTPTSGNIYYFGKDFATHTVEILECISFASPYTKLPGSLTIQENLQVYSFLYNISSEYREHRIKENLHRFGLWEIRNRLTKHLSAGQLTRLMIAKAFLANPKIVLLDEPTAALDPDIAAQIREFIMEQRKELGMSILLTSHNMAEVEEVCDRVVVLKDGTIIATDSPQKLAGLIQTSHLRLLLTDLQKGIAYAQAKNILFKVEGKYIEFEIAEQAIPELLADITHAGLKYVEISIEKPSLQDYFLTIAKKKKHS